MRACPAPLAKLVPHYAYDDAAFFRADDASEEIAARRRAGFERLSRELGAGARARSSAPPRPRPHISDLQFTESYRVPFQFSPRVRAALPAGSFVARRRACRSPISTATPATTSPAPTASTSWATISTRAAWSAARRASRALGPVLGHYPSLVADNAARLARDLGQGRGLLPHVGHGGGHAGRAARPLSHRPHATLVRFCGAYHGWWGDVQPGVGNPVPAHETYTLADMSERTLGRAAHAARHRLRAGQPRAGDVPQQRRAGRFDPGRTAGRTKASIAPPTRPG